MSGTEPTGDEVDPNAVTLDGKRTHAQLGTAAVLGDTPEVQDPNLSSELPSPTPAEGAPAEAQSQDEWPSALPTQPPSDQPLLFAGLLAEAAREAPEGGDKRKAQETLDIPGRGRSNRPAPALMQKAKEDGQSIRNYRVLGELGSGGMAVVYKAAQPSLDRLVAIKELRQEYMSDDQVLARFEREATSLAQLQHGNIVHVYDFFRDNESAYIVMEFVEGVDLFDLLAAVGRLPTEVAALLTLQVAEALEYAHYRGIVHRDVKPSNVLISTNGEVKLMDFGIARDPGRSDLTQVGMSLGTPAYMAPEQISGDKLDFRADIFALGIVLYEMLSGHRPWGDEDGTAITRRVLYEGYTPLSQHVPDVPEALVRVIANCLHKQPEDRYASTYELKRALAEYVQTHVRTDPRERIVLFLKNRNLVGKVSSIVDPALLNDQDLRRADHGLAPLPASNLLRPVAAAGGVALLLVLLAALAAGFSGYGTPLADERPSLSPKPPPELEGTITRKTLGNP